MPTPPRRNEVAATCLWIAAGLIIVIPFSFILRWNGWDAPVNLVVLALSVVGASGTVILGFSYVMQTRLLKPVGLILLVIPAGIFVSAVIWGFLH
jgi:RsiW-degrading membrane proteinase PrsW (M82 family)